MPSSRGTDDTPGPDSEKWREKAKEERKQRKRESEGRGKAKEEGKQRKRESNGKEREGSREKKGKKEGIESREREVR